MLCTYGNCVTLIDVIYKTMRYDLPLFFISLFYVRTNVGYGVAAEFIIQSEVIQVLKNWNSNWNPPFVLCDYSGAEISAIEHILFFPPVYLFVTFTESRHGQGG